MKVDIFGRYSLVGIRNMFERRKKDAEDAC